MYADDTSQSVKGGSFSDVEGKLCEDFQLSYHRMSENNMSLNLNKTQCMLIGSSQKLSKNRYMCVKLNDVVIETVHCAKQHGAFIDKCLSCNDHLDYVCKELSKKS